MSCSTVCVVRFALSYDRDEVGIVKALFDWLM